MIRDNIETVRAIVQTSFELSTDKWQSDQADNQYAIGYRQGVFDLVGQLLWPTEDWNTQRDRLRRLYDAHRALNVGGA